MLSSPARYSYESKLITSESHLKAALSLGWSNPSNKLNVNADFAYDESKSTLLVTLTQSFFSFVVDPLSMSNTFTDGKLPAEIGPYIKKRK
ncbi:MAG: hypothetical protein HC830_05755 [Bacteroidetes bacterium]|nr:hypothetical protein [Bacteroidota bacterium]